MPDLLLELFSEEIPARMQADAAANLARLLSEALAPLSPSAVQTFFGPRRIALAAAVNGAVPASQTTERGPRTTAPAAAIDGFLRKHGASRGQLSEEGGFFVLTRATPAAPAAGLIAAALPALLRRFPWPKSMRWGDGSAFTWVRPLRRILCVLDGVVVPFRLAEPGDDGHGLGSGDQTEGHRFHAPGAFTATSFAAWQSGLLSRRVIPDAAERRRRIADGIAGLAAAEGLAVVPDDGLLDEVAGLVEWPVPLLGRIDEAFMDLPPEVMQVSMRVNQRYFALRTADGGPAPRFAFAANIEAADGGAAVIAGNERVLRARFSDARHFWDLDRETRLADRVPALEGVTFHAKLGSQADRVRRLEALARALAPACRADPALAARAARLAKADLTTGMVAEFPELQGVMGGYYARHDREDPAVAAAIGEHYAPRGPSDPVPAAPVATAVALADKIDQLAAFFAVGEIPTGSGDPYALRRAALGVIRIIRENGLRLPLYSPLATAIDNALTSGVSRSLVTKDLNDAFNKLSLCKTVIRAESFASIAGDLPPFVFEVLSLVAQPDINTALKIVSPQQAEVLLRTIRERLLACSNGQMLAVALLRLRSSGGEKAAIEFLVRHAAINDRIRIDALAFIADRLRVQLRAEGARHDVLAAVFAAGADDDLVRLLARSDAVAAFLGTGDGRDLLAGAKRAANIVRIEDRKDGPHAGPVDAALLAEQAEIRLAGELGRVRSAVIELAGREQFVPAMAQLAQLRPILDDFFRDVTVNGPKPELRRNRLRLLAQVGAAMALAADFSRIEG